MLTTKQKKEDLVRAGKAVGHAKLSFAIKSKTFHEVSYLSSFVIRSSAKLFLFSIQVKSTSLHGMQQNLGFLWYVFSRISTKLYPYFSLYRQNLQYTGKYGYNSVYMREDTDQRKPVFRHISPCVYRNNFSYVYFNLTRNWVMYICVLYIDLAILALYIQYNLNKAINIFSL